MTSPEVTLSIVIPTYNEGAVIVDSIERTLQYLRALNLTFEIIISDDGSSDDTTARVTDTLSDVAEVVLVTNPHKGKGHAVTAGIDASNGTFCIFMDADLSTALEAIERGLVELDKGSQIVIGSRRLTPGSVSYRQPLYRRSAGSTFALLARLILGLDASDPQCGFKCFHRDVARQLFDTVQTHGFAFDAELLYLARKKNVAVTEISVEWKDHGNSSVHFVSDGFRMLLDLLRIRFTRTAQVSTASTTGVK